MNLSGDRLRARVPRRLRALAEGRRAGRAGLDRPYLVLSFDCDTEEDAAVAWEVHERLAGLGVQPVYAVPGELLQRGEETYRRIAATGAEFINHGHTEHTFFDTQSGRHASCFFYDQLPRAMVRDDVIAGDRTVTEVIGQRPRGFRAPHFGTFQRPDELAFLHGILEELGYAFSSSTMPAHKLRYGPVHRCGSLVELPVTGFPTAPLEVYDTWGCFEAPDRVRTPRDFLAAADLIAADAVQARAGLINVYGDPSHIHGKPEFFDAVERLSAVATPISYGQLLEMIR